MGWKYDKKSWFPVLIISNLPQIKYVCLAIIRPILLKHQIKIAVLILLFSMLNNQLNVL